MPLFLPHNRLDALLAALRQEGYRIIGPQARDGAIVYDDLQEATELPWGLRDIQSPGQYRLETIPAQRAFAFSNGAQALKPFLFKPRETVWRVGRDTAGKLQFQAQQDAEQPIAFFGARSCDLKALGIQDKVFLDPQRPDPQYQQRRQSLFLIAVNCSYASANCFCLSAGGGPNVQDPCDIEMSEVDGGFVCEGSSDAGQAVLQSLQLKPAQSAQCDAGKQGIADAAAMQTKRIPMDNQAGLRDALFNALDHPRWADVAERCLSCGNCTSVCPTCFCHSEVEKPALDGTSSEHQREWDSCFNAGHSYIAGTVLRDTTQSRYRQWLTHKVGSWFDQFGTSGCVGCGRCISWCPTGIDLTEELAAITGESNRRSPDDAS